MKKLMMLLALSFVAPLANANYDANFQGKITNVLTYTHTDVIYIKVEGQPTSHPICTRFDLMVIDKSMPADRRQIMMSRILLAYATGNPVNIGYDSKDECLDGSRIKVYRVG